MKDDYVYEETRTQRLWKKGSSAGWYSSPNSKWKKRLMTSLPAYIGLDLILYLVLYFIINVSYRAAFEDSYKAEFVKLVRYFKKELDPLSRDLTFLLGFYVSLVVKRWWDQYLTIPWPEPLALINTALTVYETEDGCLVSEELLRYHMLAYILCLRKISKVVKNDFSTNTKLLEAGLVTSSELKVLETAGELDTVWWLPLQWSMHRVKMGADNKTIPKDHKEIISETIKFWQKLENLECHQHVPIPPIYRQVVRLAIYAYFALALVSNQMLEDDPPFYIPIFLILKFIFFIGWFKVAEALRDPFGDDLDDFEIGPLISRHIWACGVHISAGVAGAPPPSNLEEKMIVVSMKDEDNN